MVPYTVVDSPMLELLQTWLQGQGIGGDLTFYVARGVAVLFVLLLSVAANFVAKRYILSSITYIISRSKTKWDDAILRQRVPNRLAQLAPALVMYELAPYALEGMVGTMVVVNGAILIYMIIVLTLAVVPEFDLRVYQNPSGSDFRGLVRANQ